MGNEEYECENCGKRFDSTRGLNVHRSQYCEYSFNDELDKDLSWILGTVGPGDGWIANNGLQIGLKAVDLDFIEEFENRVEKKFGIGCHRYRTKGGRGGGRINSRVVPHRQEIYRSIASSKPVVDCITKYVDIESTKEGEEIVPDCIKNANKDVISPYLSAFFDSQGGPCKRGERHFRIIARKYNLKLLKEIKELLSEFDIVSRINYRKDEIHITRRQSKEKFAKHIGFSIKRKIEKLKKLLGRKPLKLYWTKKEEELLKEKYPTCGSEIPELLERRSRQSIQKKAEMMGLSVEGWDREKVIEELREAEERHGSPLKERDIGTNSSLYGAVNRYFDNWNHAKREAGLETVKYGDKP